MGEARTFDALVMKFGPKKAACMNLIKREKGMKTLKFPRLGKLLAPLAITASCSAAALLGGAGEASAGICPAFGADTDCGTLIVLNADGSVTLTNHYLGNGPYDGIEDTLVGVVNNTNTAINTLGLQGSFIFGFDGDGIQAYGSPGNAMDTSGYGGPTTWFTVTDSDNGIVNFIGGLAAGTNTYFSLEEDITSVKVTSVNGSGPPPVVGGVPLPAGGILLFSALGGLGAMVRRRKSRA